MNAYRFIPSPEEQADAPWRPLDRALLRWTLAHGGSALLARVAAWASLAEGEGDTALPLRGEHSGRHGMASLSDQQIEELRGQPLVGSGAQATPFVLDAQGVFYLWRNHRHEVVIARQLRERRAGKRPGNSDTSLLDALFLHDHSAAVQRQREAVAAVIGRRWFVLTGGPGTGKTTTVLRMLLMLQRQASAPLTIQVGAPTGKAAQRLVQSLRQGRQTLADRLDAGWADALASIPDGEALTLHRLLGYDPRRNRFLRTAAQPIAADVVVVDEASMMDLGMLRALLDAVRADATLILVGDAEQLTSVAAGSVLMDLVAAMEAQHAPDVVRLEHSFRAARQLVPVNRAVRAGDAVGLQQAMHAAGEQALQRTMANEAQLTRELGRWTEALAALPIRPAPADARDGTNEEAARLALRALGQRQLLCALREESFGAVAINAWIERRLKRHWNEPDDRTWYAGRAVLITRNDYAARLYNGDVGLCLAGADGALRVWFETDPADGQGGVRSFAPGTLPAHESAFAITIHKSQGSEYAHVAVMLPPDPAHRILSRQLLYTALSRARQKLELWSSEEALRAALAQPVQRASGLAHKLRHDAGTATVVEPEA